MAGRKNRAKRALLASFSQKSTKSGGGKVIKKSNTSTTKTTTTTKTRTNKPNMNVKTVLGIKGKHKK